MSTVKKIILSAFLLLLFFASIGMGYFFVAFPRVDAASEIKISSDEALIEKGAYLANHVAICMDCHSERDWTKFAGPLIPGSEGMGGELFDEGMGLPGKFYARNITPYNLSDWTDGEIYRLITTGVTKDNEPIFPIMPYASYSKMAPEDVHAIVAYLRSLAPIEHDPPASEINFPMNVLVKTIPKNAAPTQLGEDSGIIAKGKYLTTIAGCGECHTPANSRGEAIESLYLAGGFEFRLPRGGTVRSANLTPDLSTGIGKWTSEQFVGRFKSYNDPDYVPAMVPDNSFNTIMPWLMYKDMKTEDLEAIFAYLQTVEPVNNLVTKFSPDTVK